MRELHEEGAGRRNAARSLSLRTFAAKSRVGHNHAGSLQGRSESWRSQPITVRGPVVGNWAYRSYVFVRSLLCPPSNGDAMRRWAVRGWSGRRVRIPRLAGIEVVPRFLEGHAPSWPGKRNGASLGTSSDATERVPPGNRTVPWRAFRQSRSKRPLLAPEQDSRLLSRHSVGTYYRLLRYAASCAEVPRK